MSKLVSINNKKILIALVIFLMIFSTFNISTAAEGDKRPDLAIESVNFPDEISEGEQAYFVIKIKNQGEANISAGTKIGIALKFDYAVIVTNSTYAGLDQGESKFINLSWTPGYGNIGLHLLSFEIDYEATIVESDENNNVWDSYVNVLESNTSLEITSMVIQGELIVDQSVRIDTTIVNNGKDSTEPIYAKLTSSEDGDVQTLIKGATLVRGGTYVFSFTWIPSHFGSQTITANIIYQNKTHDSWKKSIVVGIDKLQWWNSSWHYRYFTVVNGSGNISLSVNFTEMLENLGVVSETFENDTIRVIKYNSDGEVVDDNVKYRFNESVGFDKVTNATGTLIWNVTGSTYEKYYCIYFDVSINHGSRTELVETDNMNKAGDADKAYFDLLEGWWVEIANPKNNSYTLVDTKVNITAETKAKAENVSAFIFLNDDPSYNFTIYLTDITGETSWRYSDFLFDREGYWTIRVTGRDWTGYTTKTEHLFYVGKPDLEVTNLTFTTDWSYTSPTIYKGDKVNITANLIAHNATIENVKVLISIIDLSDDTEVFTQTKIVTIYKDKNNSVSFNWDATESGDFNVIVTVDPDDDIDEQNELNNEINKTITVHNWPDLIVRNLVVPSEKIKELESVDFEVTVGNIGQANAKDYKIRLYVEPAYQKIMTYTIHVSEALISVPKDTNFTFDLVWGSSKPGDWLVGVKILVDDTKRDTNIENNRLLSNRTLTIESLDRTKPVIDNITIIPSTQEQGKSVTITADITDNSGLKSVTYNITDPSNNTYEGLMIRTTGDEFEFTFEDTLVVGKYTLRIEAIDRSVHMNKATAVSSFNIYTDKTSPVISYYGANPRVQLPGEDIEFSCITKDNVEIKDVKITITSPSEVKVEKTMRWYSDGRYTYTDDFDEIGKYRFYVKVSDTADKKTTTESIFFWITPNLNDIDNDGMPNEWEERYGLNPEDPNDANEDLDNDGLTNLEEYKAGNNPTKNIFGENAAFRIGENSGYLSGTVFLFILILIFSYVGIRRIRK